MLANALKKISSTVPMIVGGLIMVSVVFTSGSMNHRFGEHRTAKPGQYYAVTFQQNNQAPFEAQMITIAKGITPLQSFQSA